VLLVPQLGLLEDFVRGSASGPAAGVGPFGVVVAQIALQIQAEAGLLGDEIAGEGWLPAFVQDGLLDSLDTAVGLRSAGTDEAVPGSQLGDGGLEGGRAELRGVEFLTGVKPGWMS
jgi:hypothetical protein